MCTLWWPFVHTSFIFFSFSLLLQHTLLHASRMNFFTFQPLPGEMVIIQRETSLFLRLPHPTRSHVEFESGLATVQEDIFCVLISLEFWFTIKGHCRSNESFLTTCFLSLAVPLSKFMHASAHIIIIDGRYKIAFYMNIGALFRLSTFWSSRSGKNRL